VAVTAVLHQRDGVVGDASEIRSRDVWIVTTDPPGNGDTSNPTGVAARAAGLPGLLTAGIRADAPQLLADSYGSCRCMDEQIGTTWEVEVLYSDTGRFRYEPTLDRRNVGFNTIQDASIRQVMEIPYFSVVEAKAGIGTSTNGPWKFIKGVTRTDLALTNPQLRVNVNKFTFEDREKIKAELNKIHSLNANDVGLGQAQIPPIPSKFVSYNAEQHADGLWTLVYSWIQDPGNKKLQPGVLQVAPVGGQFTIKVGYADGTAFPGATSGIETLVCGVDRPPFWSYVIIPAAEGTRPNIKAVPQYAPDDITGYNGAHGLPGRPV